VSDIDSGRTYRYDIKPDGHLTNKQLYCEMGSDGMTIDHAGNVYLTNHGVTAFDTSGQQIMHIDVPERWCGNICFGGRDRKLLFITATTSIYGIRMNVHGV
jgi:gluconolactonase